MDHIQSMLMWHAGASSGYNCTLPCSCASIQMINMISSAYSGPVWVIKVISTPSFKSGGVLNIRNILYRNPNTMYKINPEKNTTCSRCSAQAYDNSFSTSMNQKLNIFILKQGCSKPYEVVIEFSSSSSMFVVHRTVRANLLSVDNQGLVGE